MTSSQRALELRKEMAEAIEAELADVIAPLEGAPQAEMGTMVRYHFGWQKEGGATGGKRIRPLLSLLVCAAAGGHWSRAVPAAAAVELVHNFSLIHDDIEDASETRRGRPTLWVNWNLPQALNTGDALLILSQAAIHRLRERQVPDRTVVQVFERLNRACLRLTIGQHLDLDFEGREEIEEDDYLRMVGGKTSALIGAASAIGAQLADAPPARVAAYESFGVHLGMAFQIEDDILGIWGEPEKTGKPAGDDLRSRKKSLPVVYGLARAQEFRQLWSEGSNTHSAIEAMKGALAAAGARRHAAELASEHTELALGWLAEAKPTGPAAAELEGLANRLLGRDR